MAKDKGIAALILSKPKGEKKEDDDSGRKDAAEEVMSAIKANDVDAFDEALHSYIDICTSSADYEE